MSRHVGQIVRLVDAGVARRKFFRGKEFRHYVQREAFLFLSPLGKLMCELSVSLGILPKFLPFKSPSDGRLSDGVPEGSPAGSGRAEGI